MAREINRNAANLPQAFANYDETLRPFVNEIQNVNPFLPRLAIPETQWGIAVLHFIAIFLALSGLLSVAPDANS